MKLATMIFLLSASPVLAQEDTLTQIMQQATKPSGAWQTNMAEGMRQQAPTLAQTPGKPPCQPKLVNESGAPLAAGTPLTLDRSECVTPVIASEPPSRVPATILSAGKTQDAISFTGPVGEPAAVLGVQPPTGSARPLIETNSSSATAPRD